MTVTVQMIRNAAVMDVDISVWLHMQVFMCGCFFFFFFLNAASHSAFSDLVSVLCLYNRKARIVSKKTLRRTVFRGVFPRH